MKNQKLKTLLIASMLFCTGLVLPLLTGQIPQIGNMLLPMHIPVFLCGLICNWKYGAVVGATLPLVRSLIFGMPVLFPTAIAMAFELAAYGFLSGLIYERSRWHCIKSLYLCLGLSMLGGRIVWGIAQTFLLGFSENGFTFTLFITNGFINAIPGIILQLILIPSIMLAVKKTHLMPTKERAKNHETN
ncbi:MAG: ECF transporter S component [Clostridia bacterium]|nr:ECF transporter S component [Clostridia bacterium]